jgi:DNA-directed RNA polymerase specialized sigma24 family protein
MSHADAANILGVKESTISWQVHEARKTLKGLLS